MNLERMIMSTSASSCLRHNDEYNGLQGVLFGEDNRLFLLFFGDDPLKLFGGQRMRNIYLRFYDKLFISWDFLIKTVSGTEGQGQPPHPN